MSDSTYIFDNNTLTLYNIWIDLPLNKLKEKYPEIISGLSEYQKNQYNFWLSLSDSQKEFIRSEINNGRGPILANIRLYGNVKDLNLEELANILSQGKIVGYKVLNDDYMQFTDNNGNNYLVYGKYDPQTNQILPHR